MSVYIRLLDSALSETIEKRHRAYDSIGLASRLPFYSMLVILRKEYKAIVWC